MRINNNIMAMNAYRQLGITNNSAAKAMEKLSSGYRINRAGDDAAGLAISEKMRAQIRGLNMASKNAQDGISLIQTAEGALTESHAILQRMRELAVQSANDTNVEVDRSEIQKEIDQLAQELTRIADTTEFNTQNLLGGNFKGKFHIGANEGQDIELRINNMNAEALGVAGKEAAVLGEVAKDITTATGGKNFEDGTYKVIARAGYKGPELSDGLFEGVWADVTHLLVNSNNEIVGTSAGNGVFTAVGANEGNAKIEFSDESKNEIVNNDEIIEVTITDGGKKATAIVGISGDKNKLAAGTYEIVNLINNAVYGDGSDLFGLVDATGKVVALGYKKDDVSGNNVKATTLADVTKWVDVNDTSKELLSHSAGIKIDGGLKVGTKISVTGSGIDVSSQEAASAAITTINKAIETVSAERSKLGAYQNRLEHTIRNLDTSAENLQASESRIRDVDYAEAA